MKKQLLLIAAICLVLPILLRGMWYYQGFYLPIRGVEGPDYAKFTIPQPTFSTPAALSANSSSQRISVVFDMSHGNRFSLTEIDPLINSLLKMGTEVQVNENQASLESLLKDANAYVVIAPATEHSEENIRAIHAFIERGGKLLVIADPTRTSGDFYFDVEKSVTAANMLLDRYGIAFLTSYVYHITHNEGNFRNVFIQPGEKSDLTKKITAMVFYGTHSLIGNQMVVLKAEESALSSANDRGGGLPVAMLTKAGNVLAMGDMNFMTTPFNQVADNNQLVLNLVEFLAGQARPRTLADFPDLFTRPIVVLENSELTFDQEYLDTMSELQVSMLARELPVTIDTVVESGRDVIVIGLYPPSELVQPYTLPSGIDFNNKPALPSPLSTAASTTSTETTDEGGSITDEGSTVSPTPTVTSAPRPKAGKEIIVPAVGAVPSKGFSFILYYQTKDRNTLVLLAESQDKMIDLIQLISNGSLSGCLVQPQIAVCPGDISSILDLEFEDELELDEELTSTAEISPTPTPETTPEG
jgi:hypothetical protein